MENRILKKMSRHIPLVKTATVKLSRPQSVEVGLNNGRVLRVVGAAAREPINAIALARQSSKYHSTLGLPTQDGGVVVVTVDGKHLSATFKS
jgi:hypothetical protein